MMILEDFIDRLKGADSLGGQRQVFEQTISDAGFRFYTYNIAQIAGVGAHSPVFTTSYPDEWVQHYLREDYYSVDPLVSEGPRRQLPFLWEDITHPEDLSLRQQTLYAEAADMGITCGITIPIHGRDGEYAGVNLIPDGTLREQAETLRQQRHFMHLVALYYHSHSGIHLLEQRFERPAPIVLSPREQEILTWVARGKSSWDVSLILNISERTVLFHIENAKKKLGVTSRTHLVVKAAMDGLISP